MADVVGSKIFVKSYELIDSGTINLFCDEFGLVIEGNIRFYFHFKKDKNKKAGDFEMSPINDKELDFNFYDFSNALPQGYYEPLALGHLRGRRLYINFSICTIDQSKNARTFTYNIFLGEQIND
jgi:hypothetical protein